MSDEPQHPSVNGVTASSGGECGNGGVSETRYRRIASHIDDLRTELQAVEDESPPELRHLKNAHDALNAALRAMHHAMGMCSICGGVGRVRQAGKVSTGFDWLAGQAVTCPVCGGGC